MTTDTTNSTLWQEWLIHGFQNYTIRPLTVIVVTLLIFYFPHMLLLFLWYSNVIFVAIYKKLYSMPEDTFLEEWDRVVYLLASTLNMIGKVLHDYEICGIENLPEGPGVIIYYHGSSPFDYVFFLSKLYCTTGKYCFSVVDHLFHWLPGTRSKTRLINVCNTREECVEILKKGCLLAVAPGGLREQNYGDNTYRLIWGKRKGFARVAIDAKAPIIPMFTQNIREGYWTYGNIWPMRWIYELTRYVVFPLVGPIPVKLWTHIGEPIPYDPNITAEELAEKTKAAIEALRDKHQKIPGSIRRALWERFEKHRKAN